MFLPCMLYVLLVCVARDRLVKSALEDVRETP